MPLKFALHYAKKYISITSCSDCDGACFPPKNCHNHLALPEDFCVCRNFILSPSRCSLSTQSHTVDQDEVSKFRAMCGDWWKPDGSFAALHTYNELRIPLIRDGILQQVYVLWVQNFRLYIYIVYRMQGEKIQ